MKTLQETLLDRNYEVPNNAISFDEAEKWLKRRAISVKGLKYNRVTDAIDADEIRFWAWNDLEGIPEWIHLGYVKKLIVDSCQWWNNTNYPDRCDLIILKDVHRKGGYTLENFGGVEIDTLKFIECNMAPVLKIPKDHKITNLRLNRCNLGTLKHIFWDQWLAQCKRAHINLDED